MEETGTASNGDAEYRVLPTETWVGRTIIRSAAALTYDQAKSLIAGNDDAILRDSQPFTAGMTFEDAVKEDFDGIGALSHLLTPEALDPASFGPAASLARARLAAEASHYPWELRSDAPAFHAGGGGTCGQPLHAADAPALRTALRMLSSVARWLARRRGATGALDFNSTELRFQLGPSAGGASAGAGASDGEIIDFSAPAVAPAENALTASPQPVTSSVATSSAPIGVKSKRQEEINNTIAELMIFANEAVGKLIYGRFPNDALLRRHTPAEHARFASLVATAASAGFTVDTSSNAALAKSLAHITAALSHPGYSGVASDVQASLIRALTLVAMNRAEYFATGAIAAGDKAKILDAQLIHSPGGAVVHNLMDVQAPDVFGHYGLGLGVYTHFTSPIRRYADLMVHRLVVAALDTDGNKTTALQASPGAVKQPIPSLLPVSLAPSVLAVAQTQFGDRPAPVSLGDLISSDRTSTSYPGASVAPTQRATVAADTDDSMGLGDDDDSDDLLGSLLTSPPKPTQSNSSAVYSRPYAAVAGNIPAAATMSAPIAIDAAEPVVSAVEATSISAIGLSSVTTTHRVRIPPLHLLDRIAHHLNDRNLAAKVAGMECDELFLAMYFRVRDLW
jgi:hypothetical protein